MSLYHSTLDESTCLSMSEVLPVVDGTPCDEDLRPLLLLGLSTNTDDSYENAYFRSSSYMSGCVLSALRMLTHFISTTNP